MDRIKIITSVVIIILLVGLIVGYRMYNKPHRNVASEKPAYRLSSDELYREFELDEAQANTRYLDEVLLVTGVVGDVSTNSDDKQVITLTAEGAMMGGISATMAAAPTNAAAPQPGDDIALKCRCTGKLMDVVLVDCSIAKDIL